MIFIYIAYATAFLLFLISGLSIWIIFHNIYSIRRERLRQANRALLHKELMLYINGQLSLEKILNSIDKMNDYLSGVISQLSTELEEQDLLKLNQLLIEPHLNKLINREIKKIKTGNLYVRQSVATYLPYLCPADKVAAVLIESLNDAHDEVRLAAAHSLAKLNIYSATAAIIESLLESTHIPWERAVEVITTLGQRAVDPLIELLRQESSSKEKSVAIACLGFIHATRASQIIESFSTDPDTDIRIQVAKALGKLKEPASFQVLIKNLGDKDWEVRAMCAQSLGDFTNVAAISALEKYLGDPAYWVRYNTANSLGKLGTQGLAALKRNINSRDQFVRDICKQMIDTIELKSLSAQVK